MEISMKNLKVYFIYEAKWEFYAMIELFSVQEISFRNMSKITVVIFTLPDHEKHSYLVLILHLTNM